MIPSLLLCGDVILSKPRASGDDPLEIRKTIPICEVNPARAGMIRRPSRPTIPRARKPRASGDDPQGMMPFGDTIE